MSLLATLHKGDDQSVYMNISCRRPPAPMFSSLHMCGCAEPACTSSTSTPALCFLSSLLHDVHAARPPVFSSTHGGFSDARGLIIESEYSYREDGSQNHKVTWNKSSLAISVSLITPCQVLRVGMRRRPGAVSCERVLVQGRSAATSRDCGPYQLN